MITLEGNIKILKFGYKTGHIEVVDVDNDILYVGEVISEVIYELGEPLKVKLYHYTTMNGLDETNEWLKKSIKRQQLSNEECSKYIEEVVKENEQLKSTNMEMEDYLGRLEERIIELEKENQEMNKK